VAGHEVGLGDVVRALDGLVAEAQMADGDAAGLLGVVLEICLNVLVGVVADDLDGVLVGADGAVAAQTPELALDGALGRRCPGAGFSSRDRWVTSSTMPTVKRRLGSALAARRKHANTLEGGVSLEPRP
jgi:hypothetical protein